MDAGIALAGESPGPIAVNLTLRATAPGFTAGPLTLPGGRDLSWTVAAPSARVTGTVRAGDRTLTLRGAPGYHDHNYGRFDLGDASHGGWDWSQVHLPEGRSLVTGIVRPADPSLRDGVVVLSDAGGRLASGRAAGAAVARGDWTTLGPQAYPRRVTLRARLSGGWRARVVYRARRASPLRFTADGSSALVEVEARTSGTLRKDGRVVSRWTGAPAFYEYESTPLTRERDAAPGSLARAALGVERAVAALPTRLTLSPAGPPRRSRARRGPGRASPPGSSRPEWATGARSARRERLRGCGEGRYARTRRRAGCGPRSVPRARRPRPSRRCRGARIVGGEQLPGRHAAADARARTTAGPPIRSMCWPASARQPA